ncbi:MAG: hypothetical protein J5517_04965 [Eubacterium sp.]|nr:hypothetical protein [Eubacterium sp.]
MAFFAMILATGFIIIVVLGLAVLLLGIILDIIWGVRKKQEKKVPVVLKVFALLLTIIGVVQGIGPLAAVGIMQLKSKMEYRSEISDLPDDCIVHLKDYDDMGNEFDFRGVHYISASNFSNNIIVPWEDPDIYKTTKIGAFVFDNGKHYIINKIENDLDVNILDLGLIYDPYVPQDEYYNLTDYYKNEAPLCCKVWKDTAEEMKEIYAVDSDKVRAIRDYLEENGQRNSSMGADYGYLYFYSNDSVYYFEIQYAETEDGLVARYNDHTALLSSDDAKYIRSLLR